MRIIALSTLKEFWEKYPQYIDAKEPVLAWYRYALAADWKTPSDVKQDFRSASILKDGRVVFNIAGNKYRLIVWINFTTKPVKKARRSFGASAEEGGKGLEASFHMP